jgi:hypothetical protein
MFIPGSLFLGGSHSGPPTHEPTMYNFRNVEVGETIQESMRNSFYLTINPCVFRGIYRAAQPLNDHRNPMQFRRLIYQGQSTAIRAYSL